LNIVVREERPADAAAIGEVARRAFRQEDEARLVGALRAEGYGRLSLVATTGQQVIGHVLFSRIWIDRPQGRLDVVALAPLAVLPEFQGRGVGSALVGEGLARCREQGERLVLVLGDPVYYARFGFQVELAARLDCPYAGPHFMGLELVPHSLPAGGCVVYSPPFERM
jgi:putative acetyltransferase